MSNAWDDITEAFVESVRQNTRSINMSMELSSSDLREIADQVEAIEKLNIDIREFRVRSHGVYVKKLDDQRDGSRYVVVGITNKVMRDGTTRGVGKNA